MISGRLRFSARHRARLRQQDAAERKRLRTWNTIDALFKGLVGDSRHRAAIIESRIGRRPPRGYVCPPWMQPTINPFEAAR